MASAILTSRNEPRSSDYMSNFTNNSNLNFTRLQNIQNPNPNPNSSHFFTGNTNKDGFRKNHEHVPCSAPPQATFIRSSICSVPANSYGYRYITFRLGTYTRRELKQLKKRLMSDLERVRVLRHWISSTPMPKKSYYPPQLELPTPREVAVTAKESQKSTVGQKRTKPYASVRETKKHCGRVKNNAQRSKLAMKNCGKILSKLMTQKHGWVFNTPVDAAALKLYDYHNIIKNPMDLGTIKSKLGKNEYESPIAFASDVRLTFENAMVYNGKGSDVFVMAERLLLLFEEMFNSAPVKYQVVQKQNRPAAKKAVINAAGTATFVMENPILNAPPAAVNLGKPLMTSNEKSELADSLHSLQLGAEEMDQIMTIVKKGALGLEHQGDEIELDLGVLDNETLWELHSFIGSFTIKENLVQTNNYGGGEVMVEEEEEGNRKREGGEEDVDIGDEIMLINFPLVKIEKDSVNVSSSSNSSSSSGSDSSSSESGSGSSSGNSCNEEEAKSTAKG